MADLAAFLAARLDEDEALARQAAQVAGPDWTFITEVPEGRDYPTDYITSTDGALLLDTMGGIEGDAPHVARHDPARVLREVAAKRAILAAYERSVRSLGEGLSASARRLVEALAAVYSDHPDYDPAWS